MVDARSELEAVPDEPAAGMKSCTWRNRSGEGGMLILQPCDPGSPWGLSDQPRPGSGGREGCFWEKPGAHQEAVPGIGREARIWRMSEAGMPDDWVADALTDAGTLEVWVNDAAGRGAVLAFLQAAVDRSVARESPAAARRRQHRRRRRDCQRSLAGSMTSASSDPALAGSARRTVSPLAICWSHQVPNFAPVLARTS